MKKAISRLLTVAMVGCCLSGCAGNNNQNNNINTDVEALSELQKKMSAFDYALATMSTDGQTVAPKESVEVRADAMSTLYEYQYDLSTSKETIALLKRLSDNKDKLNEHQQREVELLLREYENSSAIPKEEFTAYKELIAKAEAVWEKAKDKNDFSMVAPYLEKIIDAKIRIANYINPGEDPYDVLLSENQRGLSMKECDAFFEQLRENIVPLLKEIQKKPQIDDSVMFESYPIDQQKKLTTFIMDFMTINPDYCVCLESEHPFSDSANTHDVRFTTHYYENNMLSNMYTILHEGGHSLYRLGGADEHMYTVVAGSSSMGIDEAQSRFFENIIGRSKGFANYILPELKELFPGKLDGVNADEFYRMINKCEPITERMDADELTYSIHIMIRYELEKKMIHKEITVDEIPAEWNKLYKEYLGIDVPDDTHGVLSDVHWYSDYIGYFPSYALGNAYSAQTLAKMEEDMDVNALVENGNLEPIVEWLNERLYSKAQMYDPEELFEQMVGEEFDPEYYVDYLEKKFSEIYGIETESVSHRS